MKVLLFVLLAGCAVKCDENSYYVINMPEDPPKPFKVYWNVPTKQCKSKKIPFENLFQKFGIIQNENDHFIGEKVTILYDPGLFPALLKNETSGKFKFRNGGVPQEGDLNKHLEAFKNELDQSIPDRNFDGVGIIDFESWRPVYRQNFGVLRPYKDVSLEIERKLHWWWQKKWLEAEAKSRFEEAARTFMQTTIAFAKQYRPRAKWGFYGFPYCFNMASNNMVEDCASNVPQENDNISWLWQESTTLFPSVYSSVDLSTSQLTALIRGRVREASRFGRQILPYFWYRYRDAGFLTKVDLNAALDTLYRSKASGFIIWGSSNDVKTVQKCNKLLNYINNVMGPAIAKYTKPTNRRQDEIINSNNTNDIKIDNINSSTEVTTTSPTESTGPTEIRIKEPDPEYHWTPPENYTQVIKNHVAEEISKKLMNFTGNDDRNTTLDSTVLIDLILNSVLNNNVNNSEVETYNISKLDSETTRTAENNTLLNELLSSITTETSKLVRVESTSVTNNAVIDNNEGEVNTTHDFYSKSIKISETQENNHPSDKLHITTTSEPLTSTTTQSYVSPAVTINDNDKKLLDIETILSTESTKLFETSTHIELNEASSKNNESFEAIEDATTNTSSDIYTEDTSDFSRSKNKKKSSLQDSMEGYFDFTTEMLLSTETTDPNHPKIGMTEDTVAVFHDFTTESNIYGRNVAKTDEEIKLTTDINDSTTENSDTTERSKVNEIDSFTTDAVEISQKPSQSTTHKSKITTDFSTDEPELYIILVTENSNVDLKENNETIQPDLKEKIENRYNSSAQAPDFKQTSTTKDYITSETQNEEETSLIATSTSPDQVSGSAPHVTRSQSLYCIFFYIYSVSKCLCSIFGQCT